MLWSGVKIYAAIFYNEWFGGQLRSRLSSIVRINKEEAGDTVVTSQADDKGMVGLSKITEKYRAPENKSWRIPRSVMMECEWTWWCLAVFL
jgi:hypothetical protein